MTTLELMNLDCRKKGNMDILQGELKKGNLAKYLDENGFVQQYALEKTIAFAERDKDIMVRHIKTCPGMAERGTLLWSAVIIDYNYSKNDLYHTSQPIYAVSMYELLCKIILKMRSMVRERQTDEE